MRKAQKPSIAQQLQQETISGPTEAFQDIQEEIKLAEKENLQASLRRKELLDSLRASIGKVDDSFHHRDETRREYIRLIREGVASDAENVTRRLQKELQSLQKKAQLSHNAKKLSSSFFDKAKMFIEKKKLLERIENTLNNFRFENLSNPFARDTDLDTIQIQQSVKNAKLVQLSNTLRNDLIRLMDGLLLTYEELEERIQHDLENEERNRSFFFNCISILDETTRRNIVTQFENKCRVLSFEKRVALYKVIVERLAASNPSLATRIHSLSRKQARQWIEQGQYTKATNELYHAIHISNQNPETYRLLATVLSRRKDEQGAFAALREVLKLCPEDHKLRRRIATLWHQNNKKAKAAKEYEILHTQFPDDDDIQRNLAKILFEIKQFSHCCMILENYTLRNPEDADALKWYGISLQHQNNYPRALKILEKAHQFKPEDPTIVRSLAIIYRKNNMYEEAIQLLESTLQLIPDSISLIVLLGAIYNEHDEWEKAEQAFLTVLNHHAATPALLLSLGRVQSLLKKYNHATQTYELALQINNTHKDSAIELSRMLRKNTQFNRAETILSNALNTRPDDRELIHELAAVYTESGQWQKATELLKRLIPSKEEAG